MIDEDKWVNVQIVQQTTEELFLTLHKHIIHIAGESPIPKLKKIKTYFSFPKCKIRKNK